MRSIENNSLINNKQNTKLFKMRFSLYAALAASVTAIEIQSHEDAFADYLWAQHDAGELTTDEMMQLA